MLITQKIIIIAFLLQGFINLNIFAKTDICDCVYYNDYNCVQKILDKNINIIKSNICNRKSLLYIASENGNLEIIKYLVDKGALKDGITKTENCFVSILEISGKEDDYGYDNCRYVPKIELEMAVYNSIDINKFEIFEYLINIYKEQFSNLKLNEIYLYSCENNKRKFIDYFKKEFGECVISD